MNKIGRRRIAKRGAVVRVTREFLSDAVDAQGYVEHRLSQEMSGRTRDGRWLAWRPVGSSEILFAENADDWLMNTWTAMRKQPWEWRFIGRRRDAAGRY